VPVETSVRAVSYDAVSCGVDKSSSRATRERIVARAADVTERVIFPP
jgi:hypothetical protein